jgi:general secretion pathway protein K
MQGRPPQPAVSRNGGFALIIVLWVLVLTGFIVAHVTASGRTEIRIAKNLVANSIAQGAADGAIYEAIFFLADPQEDQRWPVDGRAREVAIGNSRVTVRLEDEASWINPSSASPLLLEALLQVIGSDPESARRLSFAIGEWVGSATSPRPQNEVIAEYRAAGLDYTPPGAPIESLDELDRVLGMTPAVLAAIRPHLTLFGPQEPNPATSDPVVAAALRMLLQTGTAAPPANQLPQDQLTVRITALASGPDNARVIRFAVVRTGATLPRGYQVLAWGNRDNFGSPVAATPTSVIR